VRKLDFNCNFTSLKAEKMISFVIFLSILLTYAVIFTYLERKVAAFAQDRLGPSHVGPFGLLQSVADLTKLLQKERIIPAAAEKNLFLLAPYLIFLTVFTGFAVMPLSKGIVGAQTSVGLVFLLGFVSLDVVGIVLAGYASNNKYSILGSMRSAAQIVSYEVPLGLSVLCVAVVAGSLDLQTIGKLQSGSGFLSWYVFSQPWLIPVFLVYFICSLAESNRAPFDLPEAESELIGGFHTEYSGFAWAIIMLSEYAMMLLTALLGAVLFLGSWNSPFWGSLGQWTESHEIWGGFWLISKAFVLVLVQMLVRWTLPRLRADQLMDLSWKYLTPFGMLMFAILALLKVWF
jgi:NADH-quinone oxidoreductase subunit H